jgi:D-alanyl-D-alanine carboxypeptidase
LPIVAFVVLVAGVYFAYLIFSQDYNSRSLQVPSVTYADGYDTVPQEELLKIINAKNMVEASYKPQLTEVECVEINTLAAEKLTELLEAAKAEGLQLELITGYVTYEKQTELYEAEKNRLITKNGLSVIRAEADAKKTVPQGGASEAQSGMLVTFASKNGGVFSKTPESNWLENHCTDYGFVLRYPQNHENDTQMNYNSQVYRYVGTKNAANMRSYGMCLNEYHNHVIYGE